MKNIYRVFFIIICGCITESHASNRRSSISSISSQTHSNRSSRSPSLEIQGQQRSVLTQKKQKQTQRPYAIERRKSIEVPERTGTFLTPWVNAVRRLTNQPQYHREPTNALQHKENLKYHDKSNFKEPETYKEDGENRRDKTQKEIASEKFSNLDDLYKEAKVEAERALIFLNKQKRTDDHDDLYNNIKELYKDYKDEFTKIKKDNLTPENQTKLDALIKDLEKQIDRFPEERAQRAQKSSLINQNQKPRVTSLSPKKSSLLIEELKSTLAKDTRSRSGSLDESASNLRDQTLSGNKLSESKRNSISEKDVSKIENKKLSNELSEDINLKKEKFKKFFDTHKIRLPKENNSKKTLTTTQELKNLSKEDSYTIEESIINLKKANDLASKQDLTNEDALQYQATITKLLERTEEPQPKDNEKIQHQTVKELIQYRDLMQIAEAMGIQNSNKRLSIEQKLQQISDKEIIYSSKGGIILNTRTGRENPEESIKIIKDIEKALGKSDQQATRTVALRKIYDLVRRYPIWTASIAAVLAIVIGNILNQTL